MRRKTRRGGQAPRLNRGLTRQEADAMKTLLRSDRSVGSAINILQDLLRYNIPGSARAEIPLTITALRTQFPNLSQRLGDQQRRLIDDLIDVILIYPRGGKKTRKNRRHK